MMRGSLNKVRSNSSEDKTDRPRTKKSRGAEPTHNKEPEPQGDTHSWDMAVHGANSDFATESSGRRKLKPIRSRLKTTQSQVKPLDNHAGSNMDMDSMTLKDMLRFLDEEEVLLTQVQSKMSEELSRLQVEEHVFLHTLKIFGETHDDKKSTENPEQSSSEDRELVDALNLALKEMKQSEPDNSDKGRATCE